MKRELVLHTLVIGLIAMVFLLANCGEEEKPEPNKPPTVSITNPANNAMIEKGETVQITVTAGDPDGSITNVKIFIDNVEEESFNAPPYTLSVNTDEADIGQHTVKAEATDNGGLKATAQITVTITGQVPTLTTADVTDITATTAVGGGNITDDGGDAITARGVVWSTTSGPTVDSNEGQTEDGTGTGTFTSDLTGLTANTTYYVKAYATNSQGTAYGEEKSFTTPEAPVELTTSDITEIDAHVAVGGGTITDFGGADVLLAVGLVWSTNPQPDVVSNYTEIYQDPGFSTTDDNPFTIPIFFLQPQTTYYVRAFAVNSNGTYYGDEKSFTSTAFTVQTGTFTDDRDGKVYNIVTRNGQTWMAENLAYLPEVCAEDAECGYWVYDYQGTDTAAAKATANFETYGVLYNWEMASQACPAGWHLPSTDEWTILEMNLGMSYWPSTGGQTLPGTDEGGKLKEAGTSHWNSPNVGATNISQFTALPAGQRSTNGVFEDMGTNTSYWTSFGVSPNYHVRGLSSNQPQIYHNLRSEDLGFSVRCIQD